MDRAIDPGADRARRGITLLEAGLAAALLLGAGGFAAWRATEPARRLAGLQGKLGSPDMDAQIDAASGILHQFVRDGMSERDVRRLFAPLALETSAGSWFGSEEGGPEVSLSHVWLVPGHDEVTGEAIVFPWVVAVGLRNGRAVMDKSTGIAGIHE